ncbi:hypothetical protein H0H93_001673 [Arthromyces matolae]|nr:hypothetical protein H0H93_001673 [Arthromyces matolae]
MRSFSLLALLCVPSVFSLVVEPKLPAHAPAPSFHGEPKPYALENGKATKVVLTNDDGWAIANIRAEYAALKAAGYKVVLSAPAENQSGTASSSATPTTLTIPCEFDSCPVGSPAIGHNASDPFLNYVNSFPVDSVRYGIQTAAPKLLGSKPDLVFSGINIGNNFGIYVDYSGTVGAATEAALEGIPSVAFSGWSGAQVSYTTLSDTKANTTEAANIYTKLSLKFLKQLLSNDGPILPKNISLNVNYGPIDNCTSPDAYKFIFTRIFTADNTTVDYRTCGSTQLPDETSVIMMSGCHATVSVFSATNKSDVSAATQGWVHNKLNPLFTCL